MDTDTKELLSELIESIGKLHDINTQVHEELLKYMKQTNTNLELISKTLESVTKPQIVALEDIHDEQDMDFTKL